MWKYALFTSIVMVGGITYLTYNKKARPATLEELAGSFSDSCDKLIEKTRQDHPDLQYISGIFKISIAEGQQSIKIDAEMYFQNPKEEWIKKTSHSQLKANALTTESLQELIKLGEVQYELLAPEHEPVAKQA